MTENINEALFKVQGELRGVKKDAKNPHFRNSYATLEQVSDTIRPHMQAAGLYWMQMPGKIVEGSIEVKTRICHVKSQTSIEFVMEMPLAKRDPQGAGSSMTYAMRYSLMAALGLPPTDDDAETAIDRHNERPEPSTELVYERPPEPVYIEKSSSHLKKTGSWEALTQELEQDMVDVRSLVALERVKQIYRKRAVEEGWNATFKAALKDVFAGYEERIKAENPRDAVDEIQDTFPGAKVVNEHIRNHPINAG